MAGTNGTAAPTRRTYNAVPKTLTLAVTVLRGGEPRTIDITGYHRDAPEVWTQIQVKAAWDVWTAVSYVDNIDPETGALLDPPKVLQESDVAEAALRRDLLLAVTEGLEEADANVLARNGGDWEAILRDLGWWGQRAQTGGASDPEGAGEGVPTGDTSSPAQVPSTAPTTG